MSIPENFADVPLRDESRWSMEWPAGGEPWHSPEGIEIKGLDEAAHQVQSPPLSTSSGRASSRIVDEPATWMVSRDWAKAAVVPTTAAPSI